MTTQTTTPKAPAATPADDFDAVFDAITKLDEHGVELENAPVPAPAAEVKEPTTEPAKEPAAAEVKEPATEPAEPAAEVKEPATEPAAAVEPTAEEKSAARIAELEAALEAAKKPAAAAPADPEDTSAKPAETAEAAAPPPIKWYEMAKEEAETVAAYEKEWPEVSAAEKVRTKAAVFNAVQYVFAEIRQAYGPVLDRFKATADAIEEHLTLQELRGAHSDYDTVRDKVVAWADTLPLAFRGAAKATLESGTPDEVNSLVAEYKKQNPVAAAPAAPAAAPVKTELSPAAKKAAGKLTVVDSKRTTQPQVADPNDFDAAWDEPEAAKG